MGYSTLKTRLFAERVVEDPEAPPTANPAQEGRRAAAMRAAAVRRAFLVGRVVIGRDDRSGRGGGMIGEGMGIGGNMSGRGADL